VSASKPRLGMFLAASLLSAVRDQDLPLLRRLGLDRAQGVRERILRRAVARALHG